MNTTHPLQTPQHVGFWSIFLIFLRLGLTSFGGPVAHLGYFREEFVNQRKWLSEKSYADVVALCQFLPGPASSQVGMALGYSQKSYAGVLAAWIGFTLPSALALMVFAHGLSNHAQWISADVIHGLKVVAVAVVAQAVWGMTKSLCPDTPRITLMILSTCLMSMTATFVWGQIAVIVAAGVFGAWYFSASQSTTHETFPIQTSHATGVFWLSLFFGLLLLLPMLQNWFPSQTLAMINAFFRAGALVFGGGHVVLPLLQSQVVPTGWVSNETFLAGYAATQAMPGPLFTFSAFLGSSTAGSLNAWATGLLCLVSIFLPSFLLMFGALPFWESMKNNSKIQSALMGVNAAVVGILLSALYDPVWASAIHQPMDFAGALLGFAALMFWKISPWMVVLASGLLSWALPYFF